MAHYRVAVSVLNKEKPFVADNAKKVLGQSTYFCSRGKQPGAGCLSDPVFSVFMYYSSFDQRTLHYLVLQLFLQYLTGDF